MSDSEERVESLFAEATKLDDPHERAEFLARSCADDPELRRDVESLLDAASQAGNFLDSPFSVPRPPFPTENRARSQAAWRF